MNLRIATSSLLTTLVCACPVIIDDGEAPLGEIGRSAITRSTPELPGERCPHGGVRVEHGVDDDGDGVLADHEVDGPSAYVCDGAPADVVHAMLVEVDDAPLDACEAGGVRVRVGWDLNGDASLDDDEVDVQALVCDGGTGADGREGLVRVSAEPAGASCPSGGQRIDAGLDTDADDVLDESEVALTRYVCDGADGPAGSDGDDAALSLVRVVSEASGELCAEGGQRVETGVDDDGDGALDAEEIDGVAYVCDAQGEGVVLGAGRAEGTAAAPVVVALDAAAPRLCTVAALSSSYYAFTTAAGEARYTLDLLGEDSQLTVRMFDDATLSSERSMSCAREGALLRCVTTTLPAESTFLLTVTEAFEVGNAFGLQVSVGADLGSSDAPLALTDDNGVSLSVRASVARQGSSTFDLAVPTSEAYTLALGNLVSSNAEGLSWRIEDDDGVHVRCSNATAPCSTGYLLAGTRYRLLVSASALGAAFDVSLSEGDAITPALPLDEVITLADLASPEARVFQLRTTAATDYTFRTVAFAGTRYMTIYDAPPETEGRHGNAVLSDLATVDLAYWISTDYYGHVSFLAPERVYYVAIMEQDDTANDPLFYLASRGGDETLVAVDVGTPHAGSLADRSSYRFTTGPSAARYTIRVERPIGDNTFSNSLELWDVAANQMIDGVRSPTAARLADDIILVTPELDANVEMELRLRSYDRHFAFTLLVEQGDTVSTLLDADVPELVTIPAGGVRYYAVDTAAAAAVSLSVTGGHARVLASDSWPDSVGDIGDTVDGTHACLGADCTGDLVLQPGRTFLSVENPTGGEQTFTVTLASRAATIALDEPYAVELEAKEAVRVWYANDAEVPHTVVVSNPQNKAYRFRVRRAADFGVEYEAARTFNSSASYFLPAGSSGVNLPLGAWILEVDGDQSSGSYPLTVTVTRP